MEFRYLIHEHDDKTYSVTFYLDSTAYMGPTDCPNYLDALRCIQMLKFPLTKFDQECVNIAEELGLEKEAA